MFSVIQPSTYVFSYLPPVQSPLAPRDVNVCPSYPSLMASTFKAAQKACVRSREHRDPLAHKRAEEPERRRQAFLKRVKDAGDDKKWQTRSDQVCINVCLPLNTTNANDVVDSTQRLSFTEKAERKCAGALCCGRGRISG